MISVETNILQIYLLLKKNYRNGVFKYTASFFFFVIIVSISFMYTANGKRQIQVENFTK